jgi:hypothetical protein
MIKQIQEAVVNSAKTSANKLTSFIKRFEAIEKRFKKFE